MTAGRVQWLASTALSIMQTGVQPPLSVLQLTQPTLRSLVMSWPQGPFTPGTAQIRFLATFTDNARVRCAYPASQWKQVLH